MHEHGFGPDERGWPLELGVIALKGLSRSANVSSVRMVEEWRHTSGRALTGSHSDSVRL